MSTNVANAAASASGQQAGFPPVAPTLLSSTASSLNSGALDASGIKLSPFVTVGLAVSGGLLCYIILVAAIVRMCRRKKPKEATKARKANFDTSTPKNPPGSPQASSSPSGSDHDHDAEQGSAAVPHNGDRTSSSLTPKVGAGKWLAQQEALDDESLTPVADHLGGLPEGRVPGPAEQLSFLNFAPTPTPGVIECYRSPGGQSSRASSRAQSEGASPNTAALERAERAKSLGKTLDV